jgi:hypothetical protein
MLAPPHSSCRHCSDLLPIAVHPDTVSAAARPTGPNKADANAYLIIHTLPHTGHLQADPDLPLLTPEQRQSVMQLARCLGDQPHLMDWIQRQVGKAHALVACKRWHVLLH